MCRVCRPTTTATRRRASASANGRSRDSDCLGHFDLSRSNRGVSVSDDGVRGVSSASARGRVVGSGATCGDEARRG